MALVYYGNMATSLITSMTGLLKLQDKCSPVTGNIEVYGTNEGPCYPCDLKAMSAKAQKYKN